MSYLAPRDQELEPERDQKLSPPRISVNGTKYEALQSIQGLVSQPHTGLPFKPSGRSDQTTGQCSYAKRKHSLLYTISVSIVPPQSHRFSILSFS